MPITRTILKSRYHRTIAYVQIARAGGTQSLTRTTGRWATSTPAPTERPTGTTGRSDTAISSRACSRRTLADLPALAPPLPALEAALNRFKEAFEESRPNQEAP